MPRFTKRNFKKSTEILISTTAGKISIKMTSNKGPSILDKMTKLLESLSKRATHTDTNDRNNILETAKSQRFQSLKLMAVVYESLMACRNDNSGTANRSNKNEKDCAPKSINFSQRINGIYKDYSQAIGISHRVTRLAKGEEANKLHSLFQGWNELLRFSKRVEKPESIFYTSYNQAIDYSKRITGFKRDEGKSYKANDNDQNNSAFEIIKKILSAINANNAYSLCYWVYGSTAAWMTKEQAYDVLKKGYDAHWYIVQSTMQLLHNAKSLKNLDQEGYKKLLQDLCDLLKKSMPSELPNLFTVSCVINTLRALAKWHLEETGEVMPTIPGILLDSISILLQMVGFRSTESDQVIKWLKKLAYTQAFETLIAILFVQLISIVIDLYAKDGKTLDDILPELCWKLGIIYSTDTSVTDKD